MNIKFHRPFARAILAIVCLSGLGFGADTPIIFPLPQEIETLSAHFPLDESVRIVLPEQASANDLFLARSLMAELSDRFGLALKLERASRLPDGKRVILMGGITNPLVREYCARHHLEVSETKPGREGYLLQVTPEIVLIAGSDERGAFYGLQSLRQLIGKDGGGWRVAGVKVRDWPYKTFRGLKLYLPGRDNIAFFKRFVRDFLALYKYNQLIIEVNAAMRLDRHPELNAGWIEFAKDLNYSRRDRPTGRRQEYQDSAHHDTADGGILEKEEVAGLVRWARQHYIEVIPEIPSLTHSYYLLTRHRELAEIQNAEWPDAYSPCDPRAYELLFDVFDEYIEVMQPRLIHIGHDEWRAPIGDWGRCRGKDPTELFAEDVNKIHAYLAGKQIRVAMWGDHLVESVRGKGPFARMSPTGYAHQWPGALSPAQVKEKIPKDILIFNWFWREGKTGEGELNEVKVEEWGFEQVYGNFTPEIPNYARRSSRVSGGAPSSWAATTEFNFGKDLMYDFLGCANLLWGSRWPEAKELSRLVQGLMPQVRRSLGGASMPSEDDPVVPLNIAVSFNAAANSLGGLKTGQISLGAKVFELAGPTPGKGYDAVIAGGRAKEASGIAIGEDASSLIFLHASARPATNEWAHRYIYNFVDTADLLGWYEIVYEDGFVESVPIRYGVNILEWNWERNPNPRTYCYRADPLSCGTQPQQSITLFAFEWVNSRFGKVVKEIRLKATSGFKDTRGKVIPENAVILKAISVVKRRPHPEPVKARTSN